MASWWDAVAAKLTKPASKTPQAAAPAPDVPPPPSAPKTAADWHPDLLPTSKVMQSSGSKALFTNDGTNYIDINDLQYPKPLSYPQHTQVVNLLLQDGVLKYDPSTNAYWHGDLLVGMGNTGPYAPQTHGLVSLVADAAKDLNLDSLATPSKMPSSWDLNSPNKPFWLKPLDKKGQPIQSVSDDGQFLLGPLDDTDITAQGAANDPWAAPSPDPMDYGATLAAAVARAARKPGENIREYVARLREMANESDESAWWVGPAGREAVANAVRDLEGQMVRSLGDGLVGPAPDGPDVAAQRARWDKMLFDGYEISDSGYDGAIKALVDKGVLRRDDEALLGPNGEVFEDGEGLYKQGELGDLVAKHLGDEFLGDTGGLRTAATQDYLDYLSANGVDQRTIDDIASGALPMDPASRASRAEQMGLDPTWTLHRQAYPLQTEFKGFTGAALSQPEKRRHGRGIPQKIDLTPRKEGLVYTAPTSEGASAGVQMPRAQVTNYLLWGPNRGIAGIDEMPQATQDSFAQMAKAARGNKGHGLPLELPQPVGGGGATPQQTRRLAIAMVGKGPERTRISAESQWSKDAGRIPNFPEAENRKSYTEPLMGAGGPGQRVLGTLVTDETPLSVAFTPAGARQLRRADLAALDPRFRTYRNLLQGLAPPVAVGSGALAVGAAGSSPRTESR